jgi:hypothetical protein
MQVGEGGSKGLVKSGIEVDVMLGKMKGVGHPVLVFRGWRGLALVMQQPVVEALWMMLMMTMSVA